VSRKSQRNRRALQTGFAAGWRTTFGELMLSRRARPIQPLPRTGEVARLKTVRSESARVRDLGKQILAPAWSKAFWHRGGLSYSLFLTSVTRHRVRLWA